MWDYFNSTQFKIKVAHFIYRALKVLHEMKWPTGMHFDATINNRNLSEQ